ncbi:MAG TPA: hypothetical protein VFO85_01105 [Vicinamibacteria bacterium]|nr:hypothetical protein [Vicinamibacteria bacterium]
MPRNDGRVLGAALSGMRMYPQGYGGGGGRLSDLMILRGQQQAEAARQQGEIWGNAIRGVGEAVSGGLQQHAAKQEEKARTRAFDAAIQSGDPRRIISVLGPRDGPAVINALKAHTPDGIKAYSDRQSLLRDQARGIMAVPPERRPQAYTFARNSMIQRGVVKAEEVPEQYDEGIVGQMAGYGEKPAQPDLLAVNPGQVVIDKANPRGGALYTAQPKPPEAPAVGSFEDYVVRKYGQAPTPEQITEARKVYQQADDRPRITVNTGGGGRSPGEGDVIADAWASGMAFPSTQGATTQALESFKRRGLPVPRKLSVAMQQDVIRSTDTLQTIDDVRAAYESVKGKTGPLSYRFEEWQTKIPGISADPDFVTFNTLLRGMGNLEIKRITGAQMSVAEADRLLKGMATGTLKPAEFEAALDVMERNARRNRDITLYGRADATGGRGGPAQPKSKAEYDRLPSGTRFTAPDGSVRVKP